MLRGFLLSRSPVTQPMINLRYHIVSITAVFLALGIGVVMGTSFLGKATVDQLKTQISRAESRIDAHREARTAG